MLMKAPIVFYVYLMIAIACLILSEMPTFDDVVRFTYAMDTGIAARMAFISIGSKY